MLAIRTMARADLDLAVEWAAQEGWNPGLRDADAFFDQCGAIRFWERDVRP